MKDKTSAGFIILMVELL